MNYAQAISRLKQTAALGSRPGLESIRQLCARLGDPQDRLPIIHIAGTNGKGSICTMTASVLAAAGYKTGLYLSPPLRGYLDSFLINGRKITPAAFASVAEEVYTQADALCAQGICPTEFEILTACAFVWFARLHCDAVVLETGLGGRLDATNVVRRPLVSVITAIAKDHTAYLGGTIAAIAREKCGIIKQGGVTVCYPVQPPEALRVVRDTARAQGNALILPDFSQLSDVRADIGETWLRYRGIETCVPMGGAHQALCAATAIETTLALRDRFSVTANHIAQGLQNARLSARQEVLARRPLVLLDGAHNLQGIGALADAAAAFPRPLAVVMGMLRDKPYEDCIRTMAQRSDFFAAVRPRNPRALDTRTAAAVAGRYCTNVMEAKNYTEAVKNAAAFCEERGSLVICGSLYMADAMRRIVHKLIAK